jgi:poly(A) polymerase/tRNA nucleotidyltransferase (CCA-adding enzyme)
MVENPVGALSDSDKSDRPLRVWLARHGATAAAMEALWLAEAADGWDRAACRARIAGLAVPVFPLLGRDLLALGLPPGPAVGALLEDLRRWWMENGAEADRATCRVETKRRLEGAGAADGPTAPADPEAR